MSVPAVLASQAVVGVPNTKVHEAETLFNLTSSILYCKADVDVKRIDNVADEGITPPAIVANVQPVADGV